MKPLSIVWQRLLVNDATRPRSSNTGESVRLAVKQLEESLRPLGMTPVFETRELDEAAFQANPNQSNCIWIAGKPMEEWSHAAVGSSLCCSVCGDAECRITEVDGQTFEVIPKARIVRAASIAALASLAPVVHSDGAIAERRRRDELEPSSAW